MQNNRGGLFKYFRDSNLKLYNTKIKTEAYLDLETYFPEHSILEDNWKEIQKEILGVMDSGRVLPKFHEVDDGQEYISDNDGLSWSLLNLMLYGMWHKKNARLCPKTTVLLKSISKYKDYYKSNLIPCAKGNSAV